MGFIVDGVTYIARNPAPIKKTKSLLTTFVVGLDNIGSYGADVSLMVLTSRL